MNTPSLTPDAILQTAFGFWNSKVLRTTVEFGLFTTLGQRRITGAELARQWNYWVHTLWLLNTFILL
jgi:hypothetical protein